MSERETGSDGAQRDRVDTERHWWRVLARGRSWPNVVARGRVLGLAGRAEREGPGRALAGRLASRLGRPPEGGSGRLPLPAVRGGRFDEPAGWLGTVAPAEPVRAVLRARSAAPTVRAHPRGVPRPPATGPEAPAETPTAKRTEPEVRPRSERPVATPSSRPETPAPRRRERPIVQRRPVPERSAVKAPSGDAATPPREEHYADSLTDRPSASAEPGRRAARAGLPTVGAGPSRPSANVAGAAGSPLPVAVVPRRVSMLARSDSAGTRAAATAAAGASSAPAHRPLVRAAFRSPAPLAAPPVPGGRPRAPARAPASTGAAPALGLSRAISRSPAEDGGAPQPQPAPSEPGIDLERLADDVYERMVSRLAAERERRAR